MAKSSLKKKKTVAFPVQVLDWKSIPEKESLYKIFFQFDVKLDLKGRTYYNLVAYPAHRKGKGKECSIGKKVSLRVTRPVRFQEIRLPFTLGNLEVSMDELIAEIKPTEKTKLFFTPVYFKTNPHAGYSITDESGQGRVSAKPSPPAPPQEA